ncbi:MAG TPA: hypothetical protein VFQ26_02425, partial [Nitrospiraceae bacterium]|nr:hypothetical protein [Nitrospiraceae bacterium]
MSPMNLSTNPSPASGPIAHANMTAGAGASSVPAKAGGTGGPVLTARRWSAVMAPLLVMSVVLSVVCLQFGTQWIGLGQIIDLLGQVLREGTIESEHIGTIGVILIQVRLPRVLLG